MKEQADPYGRGSYCIVVSLHGDGSREAEVLRDFRDRYLQGSRIGEYITSLYYQASPGVCSLMGDSSRRILASVITGVARFISLL